MGGEIIYSYSSRHSKKKDDPKEQLYKALINVSVLIMGIDQTESKLIFWNSLKLLGTALGAVTFSVWRNFESAEELYSERIASWTANRPLFRTPEADNIKTSLIDHNWRHKTVLASAKKIEKTDLSEDIHDFFSPDPYNALFIIPITYHSEFWGMISLAFSDKNRVLEKTEAEVIQSAGLLFAAATARKEIMRNLYEAKEAALTSVKSKAEFLSRMSHEMRTPLNAINGMASIARTTDDIDKRNQCLDRVSSASNQLLAIINDVLDMSKIDTDKLEIHKSDTDFEELLANVYRINEEKANAKNINLRFVMGRLLSRHILADGLRVSQVILNLMSNAVKFTPECGIVTVSGDVINNSNQQFLSIQVRDTGIGIEEQNMPLLFNAFEQADGGITRRFGGTGLGLSISKNLVGLMGGKIWAESEPGEGSVFTVQIPIEWGKTIDFGADVSKLNVSVLIISSGTEEADQLGETLYNTGFPADIEYSLSGAMKHAAHKYDIIFINERIIYENSRGEVRKLTDTFGSEHFIVTGRRSFSEEEEKTLKDMGFDDVFERPILPARVLRAILSKTGKTIAIKPKVSAKRTRDWRGKRILLAEDLEINRLIVSGILENTGIEIDEATNGLEAVEMFKRNGNYDIILMDINMPIMDGLTSVKRIRASGLPGASSVPIYALTANAFADDVKNCIDAGMNGHIPKPIDIEKLKDTIDLHI
ncbi:MAG: response regulator [Ruminococcus sp.]|jgi:signal transduction histidine kinase/DNA-binding response OmpR family regulator|nr:response regulator [Ruminococcus sp.]